MAKSPEAQGGKNISVKTLRFSLGWT